MTHSVEHSLLGKLERDGNYFETKMPFSMFVQSVTLSICLNVYEGDPIEANQEEAIRCFVGMGDNFGSVCENAIRAHCKKILESGSEPESELIVADSNHVRAYSVIFPALHDEPTWGLTCNVEWTDKGLGIKFVRDKIVEIGPEHLLT